MSDTFGASAMLSSASASKLASKHPSVRDLITRLLDVAHSTDGQNLRLTTVNDALMGGANLAGESSGKLSEAQDMDVLNSLIAVTERLEKAQRVSSHQLDRISSFAGL